MKQRFEERATKVQLLITHVALFFEIMVAIAVIIAITITLFTIPQDLQTLFYEGGFDVFLKNIFSTIIGIEFLKMLCRHDLDSVVEVLLFAVARGMIIDHMPIQQTLIGIIAIAILFVIRKFLFISALDK